MAHRLAQQFLVVGLAHVGDVVVAQDVLARHLQPREDFRHRGGQRAIGVPVDVADAVTQFDHEVRPRLVGEGDEIPQQAQRLRPLLGERGGAVVDIGDQRKA